MAQRLVRAKQQDRRCRHPVPAAGGRRAGRADGRGPARGVPGLQRGVRGERGTDDAPLARATCATRRCGWRRCCAGCCRTTPRSLGLAALLVLHDARRAARTDDAGRLEPARRAGPHAVGPRRGSREGVAMVERALRPARSGRTRSRRRSPRCTRRHPPTRRRTGRRSWRCTACSSRRCRGRWSRLNRAVALSRWWTGRRPGWTVVDAIVAGGELADHHRLHAVRAHLLEQAGRAAGSHGRVRPRGCAHHQRAGARLPAHAAA